MRLVLVLLLGLVCGYLASAAAESTEAPQTAFFRANMLYADRHYEAAAKVYEQVLEAGVESGNVYFNLGNAYFKSGKKGRAILNYERARRFMPGDSDLAANLTYVRSLTGAEACEPRLWQQLVFPFAGRVTTGTLVWITSAIYTLVLFALAIYRVWLQHPRWLASLSLALAGLFFVTVTSLAHQALRDDWQLQAIVLGSGEVPVRFEPAEKGTIHFVLKEGSLVRVLDTREKWRQIARCDGRRGWIAQNNIEKL